MTRLDAIREIIIKDASPGQVEKFDRYLGILIRRLSQDIEIKQTLQEIAPFDPHEKLIGELTGEHILSALAVVFGAINARDAIEQDQASGECSLNIG